MVKKYNYGFYYGFRLLQPQPPFLTVVVRAAVAVDAAGGAPVWPASCVAVGAAPATNSPMYVQLDLSGRRL